MEIGKPTIVDVKEPANEGQIGGQHYKAYTKLDTSDRVLHKTNVPQP
jgi:hypothetical protein